MISIDAPPLVPTVYVETTIISYLVSRSSRDVVTLAHQQLTQEFWEQRQRFVLYASDLVAAEASAGDAQLAGLRLGHLSQMRLLTTNVQAADAAAYLVAGAALPAKAKADATHIAIAAVAGLDYLLSWNCRHIVNPATQALIHKLLHELQLRPPTICTPEQLLEILP
jgi:hypothetical protein